MTQTEQRCSTLDQMLTFLRGGLSPREESELQLHLNDCVTCRERLESTAADPSQWNDVKQFFGSNALRSSSFDLDIENEEANHGSLKIRHVLDDLLPTDDPESLGRIGGYEVTGVVGAGGMGVVLKAHDRSLDRIVAIKVMAPHLASSGSARKRFAREAKAAAAVLHPNVIAIHSVASDDANPYLVMPYVRGASLQKRIDSQGPLPLKDTLRIAAQIAAGLAAAHEQGLVHRDIKPANILLEEGVERVTITDFGLARAVDDASMTCSGVIAGTPQYMSPEQTRGEQIDARSDLFSLGGVLYAMCTGRSPFRAETTYGVLHRIANDKPTPVCEVNTDVPVWLGHVIERLMAKRPEDRFESAAQVAELLEGCLAHVQQPAAMPLPEAVDALAPKKTRFPPISKFIAAAAFVFAFIFAGVFVVLELNKGTLIIQSDVDGIQVRITRGEEIVDDLKVTKGEKSIRVAAGQYAVEVIGDTDGLTVENGKVTLRRADTEVVKIIRNTHDDNQPTYTDPNAAFQAYRSNSSDSLSETIDQFNLKRTKDPLNDQPPLTKDELIACASWNVERNQALTKTQYAALSKIAKQHQWPEGWRIDGSYLNLPPYATPVRAYRISLVHFTTGEVFTVRQRFIEPSSAYPRPVLNAGTEGTQLWAAIERFNARYKQADGHKQPPLTENEVVAAIIHHQTKRDEADVSDALFEKIQQIAKTRYLPEGTTLEVIPTFGVEGGSTYTIWSVRIKMLQDEAGKDGWTYAFEIEIRDQFVSVTVPERTRLIPKDNEPNTSTKPSPEYPPIKIVVHDEDGNPLKGVRVSLFQGAAKEGGKNIEINATSNENGIAVDRILPFGNYSLTLMTSEGWQLSGSRVNVEFETGLSTTIVAPSPNKRAKLVVELHDKLHSRPTLNGLRFGDLQEHRIGNPGYSTDQLPEPGEELGGYEFFPTIVNGIEEVAIGVRFEIRRTIKQPAFEAKGVGSEWRWYSPDDSQSSGVFIVTGNGLRWNLDHASWDGKSISYRPHESSPFFKLKSSELQVGGKVLRLADPQPLPYAMDVPAGDTVIFVTNVYGKPTEEVRKSLGWVGEDRSGELWLPAPIQFNSKWLSSIVATETWTPRNYGDGYNTLVGHLMRQQRSTKQGETIHLDFSEAKSEPANLTHDADASLPNVLDGTMQIFFSQPHNAKASLTKGNDREVVLPKRVNLPFGETHYFELSDLPDYTGIQLSGSIELKNLSKEAESYLKHNAVPMEITKDDIERCLQNDVVIKAIYVPNPTTQGAVFEAPRVLHSPLKTEGELCEEAERLGATMAVLRLYKSIAAVGPNDAENVDSDRVSTTEEILKRFQAHPKATDRFKRIFDVAEDSARKDNKPLNSLYLLAAMMRDGSTVAINEVADQKKVSLKDLIQRCDDVARVADRLFKATPDGGAGIPQATSTDEWRKLAANAEFTAKQWKHDYLGAEHLLMALIADGTVTNRFLLEQGIEAAAVRDMQIRLHSPGRQAPPAQPLPKQ